MRSYHAKSYSEQARRKGNSIFDEFLALIESGAKINEAETYLIKVIHDSYRHTLVKERAAVRFGKKVREYKRKKGI